MSVTRYHRQTLLPAVGNAGQARFAKAHVLLVGCGALGGVVAEQLVRAGVGHLRIVDRDIVELSNLQRQVLFDERDATEGLPKAAAAANRLRQINSQVELDAIVADLTAQNIERFAGLEQGGTPVDLIVDAVDNADTRYLINDLSVKTQIPWVYGACVGTEGRVMAIRPPHTACLRCLFPDPPAPGELPTCDTTGVLGPMAGVIASLQAAAALEILLGREPAPGMLVANLWPTRFRTLDAPASLRGTCNVCTGGKFEFLHGENSRRSTTLCGRNAIQVKPSDVSGIDLSFLASRLQGVGLIERTAHLLRCRLTDPDDVQLTVFPDGRAIIHGVTSPDRANAIYARYIGN